MADNSASLKDGGVQQPSVKEPPPEPPTSTWTRRLIILAFWSVVVAFGLPHWLWTTSIHRSNLPLGLMNSWAEGKVRHETP